AGGPARVCTADRRSGTRRVVDTPPPIPPGASGRCTSAPAPVLVAIGMNPTLATSAVSSTVRRQAAHAFSTAARPDSPRVSEPRRYDTTIMLFSTDTPDSVMNPTAAAIDTAISRTPTPPIPPTQP